MKLTVASLTVFLLTPLLCQAVPITLFTDTDTFVQRAQDIVIAKCLGPVPAGGQYDDGLYPVDVQVVSVLKGAKKPGKAKIATRVAIGATASCVRRPGSLSGSTGTPRWTGSWPTG